MVKDFLSRRVAVMRFGSQYGNHPARAELDRVAAIIKAAMTR